MFHESIVKIRVALQDIKTYSKEKDIKEFAKEALELILPIEDSNRVQPEVSLQNADGWKVRKKVGEPEETDRYLIAYRINGMTQIKFFTADYDTHYGWSNILDDIEIMAYKKIEFDESILSN